MEAKRGGIEASEVPHRRQWRVGKGSGKEGRREGKREGGRDRGREREHCTVGSGDPSFIFPLALLALLHLRRRTLLRFRTSAAFSSPSIAAIAALTICLGRAVGLGTCVRRRRKSGVCTSRVGGWELSTRAGRQAASSRQQRFHFHISARRTKPAQDQHAC